MEQDFIDSQDTQGNIVLEEEEEEKKKKKKKKEEEEEEEEKEKNFGQHVLTLNVVSYSVT